MDKRGVEQSFSRAAASYDGAATVQRVMADALVALLRSLDPAPTRALEVGCGTGLLSEQLVRHLPTLQSLELIDLSNDMVAAAQERITPLADKLPLRFCRADGEFYPPSAPIDLWVSGATVQWFADLPAALLRIAQQLPTGGYLALSTFGPRSLVQLFESYAAVHHKERKQQARFWSGQQIAQLLQQSGFEVVSQNGGIEESHASTLTALLRQIRQMGASYRPDSSSRLTRQSLQKWSDYYRRHHSTPTGELFLEWEWNATVAVRL